MRLPEKLEGRYTNAPASLFSPNLATGSPHTATKSHDQTHHPRRLRKCPKTLLLRDLYIAFAHNDVEAILDHFADDIRWQIIGEANLRGKETVRAALEAMKGTITTKLLIHSTVPHGPEAAVNGIITTEQGGTFAICDIYRLTSVSGQKIKAMTSYVIDLRAGE